MAAAVAGLPVVAVASRSIERADERAGQVGAAAVPYRDLPAGADAVVVATPPRTHRRFAEQALAAGAAVLVEKPLCTTLADADALVAAEAAGGRVLYGENLAFAPVVVAALRETATMGRLGFIEVRSLSPRPTWGDFLDPSWGGGVLFDLGVHPLALALLLAGDDEPASVTAVLTSSADVVVDDHAEVVVGFASGLQARVEASWRHHDVVWDLQASSDTGVVRAGFFPPELERNGEPVTFGAAVPSGVDPHVVDLGYVQQMRALEALARDGATTAMGAAFGRRVLDVVCGAYASAGSGGPVPLPFAGSRDATPLSLWRS
jgi:predicted dehydrogenase